jgi:aquaporin Z
MGYTALQRYLAEFLGTFALLLFGGGAAVFSAMLLTPFGALSRVVLVSLAFGLVVAGLAWAFGDVSGGHFNPAVTVSMALSGKTPPRDVLPYLLAQVLGGIVGISVVLGIVLGGPDGGVGGYAQASSLASQGYSAGEAPYAFSAGAVLLLEVALTFVFVLVIHLATRPESSARNLAPMAIGLTLLVTNLVAIPVDGASINPARSFAPALLALYWGGSHWALAESWLFWVAPLLGGVLASAVERAMRSSN